jgi:hypothetical protein
MKVFKSLCSAVAIFASSMALLPNSSLAADAPSIKGRWKSVGLEHDGKFYSKRKFAISSKNWKVESKTFADAEGKAPLFTIRVSGFYALGSASAKVPGAFDGVFPAMSRSLTAESPAGVKMFADMGCKLEQGKAMDLRLQSCGFVPSLTQAMGEYDLAAIQNGKLFFGDRSGDLSKARPEKLTPHPLERAK